MSQQLLTQLKKPEIFQLVLKKLPIAISFVLIALCVHVLWQIAQTFLLSDKSSVTTNLAPVKTVADTSNRRAVNQLVDVNLFGKTDQKITKVTAKVPETKLNLILKGVFASTPMARSTAIIASGKNGKEKSYSIGDKLAGGVTITEIQSDYVILDRRGRSEILRMPESKDVGELVTVMAIFGTTMHPDKGNLFDAIRNDVIANPQLLLEYAEPVVVKENNKQIGYRLQLKQKGSILTEIGIEKGDIITSVNSVRLNNAKNDMKALNEFVTAEEVNITVKRGSVEIPISVQLQ